MRIHPQNTGIWVKVPHKIMRQLVCCIRFPGDMFLGDALGLVFETSPVDSQKGVFAVNDLIDSLIKTLSNCQEQLQQLDGRCEPPQ